MDMAQEQFYEKKRDVFVGIDPQPTLLGVCVLVYGDDLPLEWFIRPLTKKSYFKSSQSWQRYVLTTTDEVLHKISLNYNILALGTEQQQGRVNSIMENTILVSCFYRNIQCFIYHPKTWRKINGIKYAGSHYQNKKHVERLLAQLLQKYFAKAPDRVHDICDAYFLASAARMNTMKDRTPPLFISEIQTDVNLSRISKKDVELYCEKTQQPTPTNDDSLGAPT